MTTVRRSLAFSALDGYVALLLQITSTVIIARILTPEQTGVFAVAAVFAALASAFRDFGVAEYLIQEKQLDDDAIRAALTVNIAISWLMALLLFGLAAPTAAFYSSPGVADVMRLQAFNFVLIPFGAVTMSWFRRELNFRPIFIANVAGNVSSFAVAVTLALAGFGYMSLAWSSLASIAVTVGISMLLRPAGFPRWPGMRGVGRVLEFGKFASGITIFGQIGKGAPEMIIGRAQDMAAVGMFSRGAGLVEVFNRLVLRAVMLVALPYFARGVREEGTPRRALLHTMSLLTGVGWPFMLFMGVAAYAVIRLMYGTQWLAAVPLAQVLCAAAAVELIYFAAKEALMAMGHVRECNTLQMGSQGLRVLGLLGAIPYGLPGACWGLLVAAIGGALYSHRVLARLTGMAWHEVWAALRPSVQVSVIAVAPMAAWVLLWPIDEGNFMILGVAGGLLFAAWWLMCLRWFGHPLWPEVERVRAALGQRLRGS